MKLLQIYNLETCHEVHNVESYNTINFAFPFGKATVVSLPLYIADMLLGKTNSILGILSFLKKLQTIIRQKKTSTHIIVFFIFPFHI